MVGGRLGFVGSPARLFWEWGVVWKPRKLNGAGGWMTLIRGCDGGRGWAVNETLLSSVVDGDRVRTDHREVPSVQDVWVTYFHMLSTYYYLWSE